GIEGGPHLASLVVDGGVAPHCSSRSRSIGARQLLTCPAGTSRMTEASAGRPSRSTRPSQAQSPAKGWHARRAPPRALAPSGICRCRFESDLKLTVRSSMKNGRGSSRRSPPWHPARVDLDTRERALSGHCRRALQLEVS